MQLNIKVYMKVVHSWQPLLNNLQRVQHHHANKADYQIRNSGVFDIHGYIDHGLVKVSANIFQTEKLFHLGKCDDN